MPLFLINARDRKNAIDTRLANRAAHLDYAMALGDKLRMAGPVIDKDGETMIGSTFIIDVDTLTDAQAWNENDPYTKAGLFESVEVMEYKWLLGAGKPAT
ncbi:MAG: hypothetical protein CMK09_19155 [Ponticaulis sp.]|nr:hypothetical protein [Ponticaulis sp.]